LDDLNVNIDGSIVLDRDVRFYGSIAGTLTFPAGRRLELHGSVGKDLIVEKRGCDGCRNGSWHAYQ
jgi:cytoskeletal protein CcmA (bactofilin family)